jgi:phage tail protein X
MNNNFDFKAAKSRLLKEGYNEQVFENEELSEMAKISGDLKSSIEAVLRANPDLEGLALKKAIKGDAAVIDALGEDDLYDNQLNKFISLTKGERTLGQRGRTAGAAKPVPTAMAPKMGNRSQGFPGGTTSELDEMAKIAGDLKSSIEAVLRANPDLEGLALKKAIKGDAAVISALGEDDLYDNQLNKFISLTKGERTLGQRGRIADPNKPAASPKMKITNPKSPGQTSSKLADLAPSSPFDGDNEMADDMAKGENRLGTDAEKLAQVSKEMRSLLPSFKSAEGAEKAAITAQLKALTAEKKALDAKMFK